MGAVCINGLRTFLSERSGKSVKVDTGQGLYTCKVIDKAGPGI